jgi:MFS family permease
VQIYIAVLLAMYGAALLGGSRESIMPKQSLADDLTLYEVVFGWVGDRIPQRHALFLLGLSMLLFATAMLSFGRHISVLVVGRILQGLSAAVVWTSGLALLTDIFGQERYGEAVGYAQTSVSVGTTSAPLLGGIVYARGGYSAVSAMSIGTVAISIALALMMVEPKAKTGWEEPVPGFSVAGNNSQTAASEEVSRMGRSIQSPTTLEPASGLPGERSALIPKKHKEGNFEKRPAYPLLLRSGRILAAMCGVFSFAFVVVSFEGLVPLFVKETFHWDSTRAALIFLSWIIPGFLGPIAGKASDRLGPRWIAVGGLLFAVPPLILMRFVTKDSTSHKVLFCSLLTLVGKCSFVCSFRGAHSRFPRLVD